MLPTKNIATTPTANTVIIPETKAIEKGNRLASLDFYRGLVMVLLMLESTGMYEHFFDDSSA